MIVNTGNDVFESGCDSFDVTSNHRADTGWRHVDAAGHEHRWHVAATGAPATNYTPEEAYDVPTLEWVKTGETYWEDSDEPHDIGEWRCKVCAEPVERGFKADDYRQFVPGLRHYSINGQPVSQEEFERRYRSRRRVR